MADLVRRRLAHHHVRIEVGQIAVAILLEQRLLVDSPRLALVQRNHHGHRRIVDLLHDDVVQLVVVVSEHVQVERDAGARQYILQNFVNIVAPHIEKVEVLAGSVRVHTFARELLQVREIKVLQALRLVAGCVHELRVLRICGFWSGCFATLGCHRHPPWFGV